MASITWAGPRCVQELAAILGSQNRIQGRCEMKSLQGAIFVKLTVGGKVKALFRICPSHLGAVDVLAWRDI